MWWGWGRCKSFNCHREEGLGEAGLCACFFMGLGKIKANGGDQREERGGKEAVRRAQSWKSEAFVSSRLAMNWRFRL